MKYFTVYTTKDKSEVSVLKDLFEQEKIDFQILDNEDTAASSTGMPEKRFQVAEKDREKAEELLEQTGFLRIGRLNPSSPKRMPANKWILIFLAALILIIVAMLITWFMHVE